MMSIPGIHFSDVWERRETVSIAGTEVNFISKDDLLTAKLAAGRPQDLLDVERLKEAGECNGGMCVIYWVRDTTKNILLGGSATLACSLSSKTGSYERYSS